MSILDLIKKAGEYENSSRSVIVFLKENQNEIKIEAYGNILKRFRTRPQEEGFYNISLEKGRIRNIQNIDRDNPEVYDYLSSNSKINMVICRPVGNNNWIAIPENHESAARIGIIGSQIISFCDNCNYFDHIVCSITPDNNLIFFDIDYTYNNDIVNKARELFLIAKENLNKKIDIQLSTLHSEVLRIAIGEIDELITQREEQKKKEAEERRREMRQTLEGRIRLSLEDTGARLNSFVIRRNLVDVRWTSQGNRTYNSVLGIDNLDVISAGLCLSGGDRAFDLTSLVGVVHEGERIGRIVIY